MSACYCHCHQRQRVQTELQTQTPSTSVSCLTSDTRGPRALDPALATTTGFGYLNFWLEGGRSEWRELRPGSASWRPTSEPCCSGPGQNTGQCGPADPRGVRGKGERETFHSETLANTLKVCSMVGERKRVFSSRCLAFSQTRMWRLTRVPFYFLISSDLDIRGEGGPGQQRPGLGQ